jgi:hypothetical protein
MAGLRKTAQEVLWVHFHLGQAEQALYLHLQIEQTLPIIRTCPHTALLAHAITFVHRLWAIVCTLHQGYGGAIEEVPPINIEFRKEAETLLQLPLAAQCHLRPDHIAPEALILTLPAGSARTQETPTLPRDHDNMVLHSPRIRLLPRRVGAKPLV